MTTPDTARIRALNDKFRQNLAGGAALITPGIAALGPDYGIELLGRHR